jgi:transcriptional regulator with XRE-family HTH domain
MRFDEWMTETRTRNAEFGRRLGTSGETIRRYRTGEREPDADTMKNIFDATDGQVTPNDWVGVGPRGDRASREEHDQQ